MGGIRGILVSILLLYLNHFTYVFGQKAENNFQKKYLKDSVQILLKEANSFLYSANYESVIITLNRLHKLRLEYLRPNDPQIAYNYINLATTYNHKGDPDSAIIYLNEAEKILLTSSNSSSSDLGDLYNLMGSIYRKKGEYAFSEHYLKSAEKYFIQTAHEDLTNNFIRLYLSFLSLYVESNELNKSKEYINKLEKTLKAVPNATDYYVFFYLQKAQYEALSNNLKKSIEYQKKALDISLISSNSKILEQFSLYNNLALDYLTLNEFENSRVNFNKALQLKDRFKIKGNKLANLYINYSYYFDKLNDLHGSLDYTQKAIISLVPDYEKNSIIDNPDIKLIPSVPLSIEIFKAKANVLYKLYLKENKIEWLDASIKTGFLVLSIIEELRNGYMTYESKLKINDHEDETYKTLSDRIAKAYYITKNRKYLAFAFDVSERNKSSLLLASLGELKAKKFGEIPEDLLKRETYLNKQIAFYKELIYEENQSEVPDTVKTEIWQKNLFQLQKEHSKLIKRFETEYPKYYSFKYNSRKYNLDDIQQQLPRKTSIIEYTVTDSLLHTLVISDHNCSYRTQKIDSSFRKLIKDYLSEFQNFDFSRQYFSSFTEFCWKSKDIYNYLIKPITQEIKSEKLIIVPDGILSYIPFETLIENIPSSVTHGYFKELSYIIKKYDISYSYSATLFNNSLVKRTLKKTGKLLAFAPEYTSGEIDLSNLSGKTLRQQYRKNLYPIPGTKEEVEMISKLFNTDVFEGNSANESHFKEIADNYDVLHLAMHTVIDNKNPLYSKLVFSSIHDTINDGFLNTHEIFGLNLNACMVVLSACSTGEGEYSKGEGALSLARGFSYAGVPATVMTLWEVEDKSGSVLMRSFYENLFKGKSKSAALRDAKLQFIRESKMENSHPFFWSSFVLVGNPDSINISIYTKAIFSVSILLFAFSILFFIIYERKSH